MPITIRQALPAYGNELILMGKASSLISIVTLMEITGIARTIISKTYAPVLIVRGIIPHQKGSFKIGHKKLSLTKLN